MPGTTRRAAASTGKTASKARLSSSSPRTELPSKPEPQAQGETTPDGSDIQADDSKSDDDMPLIKTTPHAVRMSYRIGRGEQGVLTFEPYKSSLLPLWRFRTVPIARKSSGDLWRRFEQFGEQGDFVGMDMARKFIQMGMTRAKRYANHAGGRKYTKDTHEELPRSQGHADKRDKEEASLIFREVWERCKTHQRYFELKQEFLQIQKEWGKSR